MADKEIRNRTEQTTMATTDAFLIAKADNSTYYVQASNILPANSVVAGKIATGAVTTEKIINKAVTTAKIADHTITGANIGFKAISRDHIADLTLKGDQMLDNSIDGDKISTGTLDGTKLSFETVTTDKIADNAVTSAKVGDGVCVSHPITGDGFPPFLTGKLGDVAYNTTAPNFYVKVLESSVETWKKLSFTD